jgi:hypothetical protein
MPDAFSLNHLIGTGKDARRNGQADLLRSLEVYHQLEFRGLLY